MDVKTLDSQKLSFFLFFFLSLSRSHNYIVQLTHMDIFMLVRNETSPFSYDFLNDDETEKPHLIGVFYFLETHMKIC